VARHHDPREDGARGARAPRRLLSLRGRRELVALLAAFALSRLVVALLGFRFEVGLATSAVQNVPLDLLRAHLLQSLWYLHGQPPLWNALLGVSVSVAPRHWPQLWHGVYLVLGAVELLALRSLLIVLGLWRAAAGVLALAFSLVPAVLLAENSFFYDYPTLVAVTLAALAGARFAARPSFGRGTLLFGVCGYLVLTRTLFQVWWLLLVLAVLLLAARGSGRIVLASAVVPLALVAAVYVKNGVQYGVWSTTSWTGMGVARAAVTSLDLAERRRLVAAGKLHPVSLVAPLSPLAAYEAVGIAPDRPSGIPLLDRPSLPGGHRNLENRTYIRISRLYWRDDKWIVVHRPGAYVRSVLRGVDDFFTSPSVAWGGQGNARHIRGYDRVFTEGVYGTLALGRVGWFLVAAYAVALLHGLAESIRRLRSGAGVAAAVAVLTILYVAVVGNTAEVGENFRFRLVLDPLVLALAAAASARAVRALRRRDEHEQRPDAPLREVLPA
jgi:hypothetical protein